jgi:uncharacterized protein YtpQ (UPF0354 family)
MFGRFFASKKVALAEPDRASLVPRIKVSQFTAAIEQMGVPENQRPYTEPLVADLLVTYAFDLPGMFQMASASVITGLGLPLAEVREVAIGNLRRQLPQIGFEEHGPLRRIVTGNNLEACTLLASSFWDQLSAQSTDGEIVAAVPHRDIVLLCGRQSVEGVTALRHVAAQVVAQGDVHTLTSRLIVWRSGRWNEFDPA